MKLTNKILKGYSKNQLIDIILTQQEGLQSQQKIIEAQGRRIQELEERISRLEKNSKTSSKPKLGGKQVLNPFTVCYHSDSQSIFVPFKL